MKPINEYLFDPNPEIGGAIIPMVGPPGTVKTVGLCQIGKRNLDAGHKVVWRGTQQGEWIKFVANDEQVTLWNHETIKDFEAYLSENSEYSKKEIDLERKNVQVEEWSKPEDLVDGLDQGRVNVVNVPGLLTGHQDNDTRLYFFREMWIRIIRAIVNRENLEFITLLLDEMGDLFPSQQQLRKPFYKLVVEELPPLLSQLRKQNCFLYGAAHSTHDIHYFVWQIKSNSIIYTANAIVHNKITPQVEQSYVSSLERGKFVMPPKDEDRFGRLKPPSSLDWIENSIGRSFQVSWNAEIPDVLEQKGEKDISPGKIGRLLWRYTEMGQEAAAEAVEDDLGLSCSQSIISKAEL